MRHGFNNTAVYRAMAVALVFAASTLPAMAQLAPQSTPPRALMKQGDTCSRKTDTRPGVVRQDACGRWYCGRADIKDIIEVRPNIAAEFGCTWTLEAGHCKCRRPSSTRPPG